MEISTFCLSNNKREIAVGFNGLYTVLSRWEISTNLNLSKIILDFCCIINIINYSYNNKKIIGYGLHKDYYGIVFIIDNDINKLISYTTLIHTLPFKIKDMDFLSSQTDQFYTCGIQHLSLWNLDGNNLEYRNIPLNKIKLYEQKEDNKFEDANIEEINKFGCYSLVDTYTKIDTITEMYYKKNPKYYIKTTFLNIATFKTFSVLSADDGCLYLLDKVDFISKTKYHESPILSLEKNEEQKFLLSGSFDGIVLLFKVDLNTRTLKMYSYFNISNLNSDLNSNSKIALVNYNIQSIALGINKIGIGTKSGDIYEYQITDDIQIIKNEEQKKPLGKINFQDNEPPISITMDISSNKLFTITEKGLLNIININNLQLLYSNDFKIRSNHIYHFIYKKELLISFSNSIIVIDTKDDTYRQLSRYDLSFERNNEINEIKISPNEKILAVGALQDSSNPILKIYDIINGFHAKNEVTDLNSRIKYLDFSRESNYLLIENYLGEVLVIDIENGTKLTNKGYFDLEWMGNGLKYSSLFSCIQKIYNQYLDDCIIVRNKNYVAIGDNLGCLRIFKYPSNENDKCILCETDHIDKIDNIFLSLDNKYLITSSKGDGAILIYLFKDKGSLDINENENDNENIEEESESENSQEESSNKDKTRKSIILDKNKNKEKNEISEKDENISESESKSSSNSNDTKNINKKSKNEINISKERNSKIKEIENEEKEDDTEEEKESDEEESDKEEEEKEENEKINKDKNNNRIQNEDSKEDSKEYSKEDSKNKSKTNLNNITERKINSSNSSSSSKNKKDKSKNKNEEDSNDDSY